MTLLNANLQAIADLCMLEKACQHDCHNLARNYYTFPSKPSDHCDECPPIDLIPDPKLKGLLKVVQDECRGWYRASDPKDAPPRHGRYQCPCKDDTGYIVAPIWQELIDQGRKGALAGALKNTLADLLLNLEFNRVSAWLTSYKTYTFVVRPIVTGDTDLAATEVIKKWLEERHG